MNRERSRREALAVAAIFFGAVVVWGLSMWLLKSGLRGPILQMVQDQARQDELNPWIRRAEKEPLSYETVVSSPAAARGRAVVWTVVGKTDKAALFDGDAGKPLRWSNPDHVADDRLHRSGFPYRAVAVVERGGPDPLLRHLGALPQAADGAP